MGFGVDIETAEHRRARQMGLRRTSRWTAAWVANRAGRTKTTKSITKKVGSAHVFKQNTSKLDVFCFLLFLRTFWVMLLWTLVQPLLGKTIPVDWILQKASNQLALLSLVLSLRCFPVLGIVF